MPKDAPALTPEQIEYIERAIFNFCRAPDEANQEELYIKEEIMFPAFKAGKISEFSFHCKGLPPEALKTTLELFATNLHRSLAKATAIRALDEATARAAVREAKWQAWGPPPPPR